MVGVLSDVWLVLCKERSRKVGEGLWGFSWLCGFIYSDLR